MPFVYSKSKKTDSEDDLIIASLVWLHGHMLREWTEKRCRTKKGYKPRKKAEEMIQYHTRRLKFWSDKSIPKFEVLHPHWVHKVWKD